MSLTRFTIILRTLLIVFFVVLFLCLLIKDSGLLEITMSKSPNNDTSMISPLFPANRIETDSAWQITQEPVYFTARMPAPYERVELNITYQNDCCQIIKAGLQLQSDNQWTYILESLNNRHFDDLVWPSITDGALTLWQKTSKFKTIDEWFAQVDDLEKYASYNVDLANNYILSEYQDNTEMIDYDVFLRGEFSFYTYIDGSLNIDLEFQDLNRAKNEDNIVLSIFDLQSHKIFEHSYGDDGYVLNTDPESEPRLINLQLENLKTGPYRIVVSVSNDIFTRRISTRHKYLTFINKIYLANSIEYADGLDNITGLGTDLVTNSSELRFSTSHRAGLQEILVNDQKAVLSTLHEKYTIHDYEVFKRVVVPKNDVLIEGNGLFAFSEELYFDPQVAQKEVLYSEDDFDYFIANYQKPTVVGEYITSKVSFDLATAMVDHGKLRFILSAPGVSSLEPLTISSIKLKYYPAEQDSTISTIINYLKYWYANRR
jgi:hypothetical protein